MNGFCGKPASGQGCPSHSIWGEMRQVAAGMPLLRVGQQYF